MLHATCYMLPAPCIIHHAPCTLQPAPSTLHPAPTQALVAEVAGYKSESLDLLRHCTFLGQEQESARGYGDAVTGNTHYTHLSQAMESRKLVFDQKYPVALDSSPPRFSVTEDGRTEIIVSNIVFPHMIYQFIIRIY